MKKINLDPFIAQGDRIKREGFSGYIPGKSPAFQLGDVFMIDKDYIVLNKIIGDTQNAYTLVQTIEGNVRVLFPSMFSRTVRVFDNFSGEPTGFVVRAKGSAVEEYMRHDFVNEGIKALVGKYIKVSAIERVLTCCGNNPNALTYKTVYTFDFV